MTETAAAPPSRRRLVPLLAGLVLAAVLGAGGFLAVRSGVIPPRSPGASAPTGTVGAFVPVPTIIVPMGTGTRTRHLRFTAELEVPPAHAAEVARLMPRILDVLNGYLRAIEIADVEDRAGIFRLRAQMLRRIQIVTGEGRVSDLLVTEFVLN